MKPSKAQIEAAAEALALWDSHEPWLRDTWYQQGAEQALEAAFSVAPQRDELQNLRAERDALREDAERYRWLRRVDCDWVVVSDYLYCERIVYEGSEERLDTAIDAARLDGAPQPARELPPLPDGWTQFEGGAELFDANQMRDYARAAQPARVPMTDEPMTAIYREAVGLFDSRPVGLQIEFVRAIERFHGIRSE